MREFHFWFCLVWLLLQCTWSQTQFVAFLPPISHFIFVNRNRMSQGWWTNPQLRNKLCVLQGTQGNLICIANLRVGGDPCLTWEMGGQISWGPPGELASIIGRPQKTLALLRVTPTLRIKGQSFIREKNLYHQWIFWASIYGSYWIPFWTSCHEK